MLLGLLFVHIFLSLPCITSGICPSNAESILYNVTNSPATIYSHSGYESGSNYPVFSVITCIFISTAPAGQVVKLKEDAFALEESVNCEDDYLIIYDGDSVTHKKEDQQGTYCGELGPEEAYSSSQYMTLYFYTNTGGTARGFKFEASSIHEDDVPSSLGTAAIAMIVVACLLVVFIVVVIVAYVVWKKKQPPEEDEEYEEDDEDSTTGGQDQATGVTKGKPGTPAKQKTDI